MDIYPLIADKIEKNPALIDLAMETLAGWQRRSALPPARSAQWRRLLQDAKASRTGQRRMLRLLRSRTGASRRLLDFAPFAGILTREERRQVFLKCVYDH